jgi:DNA-binding CsgD family transcriptional regulator
VAVEDATAALIGRDVQLGALMAAIRADRHIAVVGEAGIGKTTLIRTAIAASGRLAHEGGAFATLSRHPYFALSRALDRPLAGEPGHVATSVERVVGPDLLFIDDLQWADTGTLAVIELLAGRIGIAAAVRRDDPASGAVLELLSSVRFEVMDLDGLDTISARAVARRSRPELSEGAIDGIVERSGGNPLLIEELALHGQGSSTLARSLLRQLDKLDRDERRAVELLAVAGSPLPRGSLGLGARPLVKLGLAVEVGGGLVIRHALIAEALEAGLDEEVRRAHHRRLAEIATDPADRARHLGAGGDRVAAARMALTALDLTPEPRVRSALLELAAEMTDGPQGPSLRVSAAQQLWALGDPAGAVRVLRDPIAGPDELQALRSSILATSLEENGRPDLAWLELERARSLRPDPASDGAIELAISEATAIVNSFARLADAAALLERASRAAGLAGEGYRLRGTLEALRLYSGQTDDTDALEAAWSESLAAGDGGPAAGIAMDVLYNLISLRGAEIARRFAFLAAERLAELGFATRSGELRAEAAQATLFAGDLEGTVVHADRMLEQPLGRRSVQRLFYNRGLALALLGRFQDAERTFVEVEPAATDDFDGRGAVMWCWAESSYWSGLPGRALRQANAALAQPAFLASEHVLPGLTRAWADLDLGERPSPLPVAPTARFVAGASPEFEGIDALAAGDPRRAFAAFDAAVEAWRGFQVPHELLCLWAAGEAARRAGLLDEALPRLERALASATAIGFEPLAARARRSLRQAGQRPAAAPPRHHGGGLLTAREREVLGLVEQGLNNSEIARRLGLGRPTVARMLSNAMLKLGAETRAQAVVLAAEAV